MRDALDEQLREWGHAQLGRHGGEERRADHDPGSYPISKARQFAPGTREKFAKQVAGRDGWDRRRAMALGAGVKGMGILPMWAVDAIRCTETRRTGSASDRKQPAKVDQLLIDLYRHDRLLGLCVRIHYAMRGDRDQKAIRVAAALGTPVSGRQFKEGLRAGRAWLLERMNG